ERCRLYNNDDKVAARGSGAQLLDDNVQSQFLISNKK
ncbi:MAG TPA: redox-sensitive transcriptional activator SoxR, partial [Alteromonas mediterranea]|nr:redox-sensitive transcriptional activator SoxR [Alteromonas mediterranea]